MSGIIGLLSNRLNNPARCAAKGVETHMIISMNELDAILKPGCGQTLCRLGTKVTGIAVKILAATLCCSPDPGAAAILHGFGGCAGFSHLDQAC